MRIDVFTIFPEYLDAPLGVSLLGKARDNGVLNVRLHDPRDATTDVHRSVDDEPFGGGAGMVMTPGPLFDIVERVQPARPLLLLSPSGRPFTQAVAHELAAGAARMAFAPFLVSTAVANLGVALAYAGIGAATVSTGSFLVAFLGLAAIPALAWTAWRVVTARRAPHR